MPYIPRESRVGLTNSNKPANAGELNYLIFVQCLNFIERMGVKYETYNTVMGVLESVKQELYRRHIGPYEETKIQQNGDV